MTDTDTMSAVETLPQLLAVLLRIFLGGVLRGVLIGLVPIGASMMYLALVAGFSVEALVIGASGGAVMVAATVALLHMWLGDSPTDHSATDTETHQ